MTWRKLPAASSPVENAAPSFTLESAAVGCICEKSHCCQLPPAATRDCQQRGQASPRGNPELRPCSLAGGMPQLMKVNETSSCKLCPVLGQTQWRVTPNRSSGSACCYSGTSGIGVQPISSDPWESEFTWMPSQKVSDNKFLRCTARLY